MYKHAVCVVYPFNVASAETHLIDDPRKFISHPLRIATEKLGTKQLCTTRLNILIRIQILTYPHKSNLHKDSRTAKRSSKSNVILHNTLNTPLRFLHPDRLENIVQFPPKLCLRV